MTAQERIEAAIAAHLQATPGPWMFIHGNKIIDNSGEAVALVAGKWKQNEMEANRNTISAAPDLVDEVILLRKWQQEALPYLHKEIEQCKNVLGIGICECEEYTAARIRGKQLNRLIAEAQEVKNA